MATIEGHNLVVSRKKGTLPRVPFLAIKEKVLGKTYDLSVSFVSEHEAQMLNMTHRNKDYIPNTLSFSLSKNSGEIVLCLPAINREYKKFEMTKTTYLVFLLIHSMLHLKGFVHGGTMEKEEKKFLTFFTK